MWFKHFQTVRFNYSLLFFVIAFFPVLSLGQIYNFKTYSIESGLAGNQIYSMIQDSKGYVWIGTNGGGISKFDGRTFENISTQNGLPDNVVRAIIEDSHQLIWVGSNGGISIIDGDNNRVLSLKENPYGIVEQSLSGKIVLSMTKDSNGNIWIGTFGAGVIKFDGKIIQCFTKKNGLCNDVVYSLIEDKNKNIWFGTNNGISKYDSKKFINYTDIDGLENNYVASIIQDSEGNILFGVNGAGIIYFKFNNLSNDPQILRLNTQNGLPSNFIAHLHQDKKGNYWIGTWGKGLVQLIAKDGILQENNFEIINYTIKKGLSNNNITSIFEDREENLWLGTYGSGLAMFMDKSFTTYNWNEGTQDNFVFSISEDKDKNIWIGTGASGVAVLSPMDKKHQYKINSLTTDDGLINNFVRIVYEDRSDKMWIGTSEGVSIKDGNKFKKLTVKDGIIHNYVRTVFEDKQGNIYLGTPAGMTKLTPTGNGYKTENYDKTNGLQEGTVYSFTEDASGLLWIGTELGISKFDGKQFINYTVEHGLVHNDVRTILLDKDENLWIGTGGGISMFNGTNFTNITNKNGLSSNRLYLMLFDNNDDDLWIGTNIGIDLFDVKQYKEHGKMNFKHYGFQDGFQGIETNTNAVCKDSRGNLWFGTITGAIKYDPTEVRFKNNIAPQTHITKVRIGRRDTILHNQALLSYHQNFFIFYFTGISLTVPEKVSYKYMLDGYDKNWLPVSYENFAAYGNVAPGSYTFKVMASNNDGIWNEQPTELKFTIIPAFWQTWWFYVLCCFSATTLISLFIKIREKNLRESKRVLEEKVELRTVEIEYQKEELREKNKNIMDSINYARNIQAAILKPIDEIKKSLPYSFLLFKPKDIVSGDFYWFYTYKNKSSKNVILATVDCTGHGVPGAFMSMIGNAILNQIIIEKKITIPSDILINLHKGVQFVLNQEKFSDSSLSEKFEKKLTIDDVLTSNIYHDNETKKEKMDSNEPIRDGMDIALCNLDLQTNELQFAGAHRSLFIIRENSCLEIVKANKIGIGGIEEVERNFNNHILHLKKGETFYLFSDGITDQFGGAKEKKYSTKKLKEFLPKIHHLSMNEQLEAIKMEIDNWKAHFDQTDDITIIGVRVG